jgi:hypothetical protein
VNRSAGVFEAVRVHTGVHLRFLARHRVFHGFVLLIVLAFGTGMVPMLVFGDSSSRFITLRALANQLHRGVSFITAGIALLLLWSHRRGRSIKMIATTPAPFPAWVASVFVTATLVGLGVQALVAALVAALSVLWNVPYQLGFLYVAINRFADSLIMLAFVTALGARVHPILAVLLLLFLGEGTFSSIRAMLEVADLGFVVSTAKLVASTLYYLLPSFEPFSGRALVLRRSMKVSVSDWRYLSFTFAYAFLALSFGFVATIAVLRRKPMV